MKRKQVVIIGLLILVLLSAVWVAIFNINAWFSTHEFKFNRPVEVKIQKPIEIVERKTTINQIIEVVKELPELDNLTPIEEYICDKWGVYECRVALAVAKSESGIRAEAWNANTNGSIDVGVFQINSVHFEKPGCSLAELVDPYKNVDCAYTIWQASGWSPWVAFSSGSFRAHL